MNDTSTLYDLVNELTHEHDVPVYRHSEYVRTRTDPPLLTILENARVSSLGRGNEARARQERVQLNIAASELDRAIEHRIRNWARTAGYKPPRTGWPSTRLVLRRWYALIKTSPNTGPHEATLRGWIHTINELLVDPPRRRTLGEPCPACNQRWATAADGNRIDALQVLERDPLTNSDMTCRNCNATWHGIDGARQLALDIDKQKMSA